MWLNDVAEDANFWDLGNYKLAVKRLELAANSYDDLAMMIKERANIEQAHADMLKKWAERWDGHEANLMIVGTTAAGYISFVQQSKEQAELHSTIANRLISVAEEDVLAAKNELYESVFPFGYKEIKRIEKNFMTVQQEWKDLTRNLLEARKVYHAACALITKTVTENGNRIAANDLSIGGNLERQAYQNALAQLEQYVPLYRREMMLEYSKCERYMVRRNELYVEAIIKCYSITNISNEPKFKAMQESYFELISAMDPMNDEVTYSKNHGPGMPLQVPVYEPFDPNRVMGNDPRTRVLEVSPRPSLPAGSQTSFSPSSDEIPEKSLAFNHTPDVDIAPTTGFNNLENTFDAIPLDPLKSQMALYDYTASNDQQLSFKRGEIIYILEDCDHTKEFVKGKLGDRVGLVPCNYLYDE